jgi:hypothetical protein
MVVALQSHSGIPTVPQVSHGGAATHIVGAVLHESGKGVVGAVTDCAGLYKIKWANPVKGRSGGKQDCTVCASTDLRACPNTGQVLV